jgi:hypothetical protein
MNDDRAFDRAVNDWLADGSDRTPGPAVDAVLLAIRTTPQERDLRIPWRDQPMPTMLRLVAAIAIVAVVGFVGLSYLAPGTLPGIGGISPTPIPSASAQPSPTPSPSPSPSPTPTALDTSTWTTYTSSQYGFELAYPPGWAAVPATRAWTFDPDAADPVLTESADAFVSPEGAVRVNAWTLPLDPGTTIESWDEVEAWVEAYCAKTDITPCEGLRERAVPLCNERRDCHPTAVLVPFFTEIQAFFVSGSDFDRMTVVSVWRGEPDASTAAYGGSTRLLEAFLSTMNVVPVP